MNKEAFIEGFIKGAEEAYPGTISDLERRRMRIGDFNGAVSPGVLDSIDEQTRRYNLLSPLESRRKPVLWGLEQKSNLETPCFHFDPKVEAANLRIRLGADRGNLITLTDPIKSDFSDAVIAHELGHKLVKDRDPYSPSFSEVPASLNALSLLGTNANENTKGILSKALSSYLAYYDPIAWFTLPDAVTNRFDLTTTNAHPGLGKYQEQARRQLEEGWKKYTNTYPQTNSWQIHAAKPQSVTPSSNKTPTIQLPKPQPTVAVKPSTVVPPKVNNLGKLNFNNPLITI